MAKVKVLRSVNHNGTKYGADEVIDGLSDKQAAQLIDSGEAVKAGADEQGSQGTPVEPKTSQLKNSLNSKPASGTRKTATEKAQAREEEKTAKEAAANGGTPAGEGDEDQGDQEVELPESFTTPEGEYSVKRNTKGAVSSYQFLAAGAAEDEKPTRLKKADYQTAYEASVEAAGEDGGE